MKQTTTHKRRYKLRSFYNYRKVNLTMHFDDNGKLQNPRNVATSSAWGWGKWQGSKKIETSYGPAWFVHTAGHGGIILVTQEPLPFEWPEAYPGLAEASGVYVYEFEEDCAWAVLPYHDPVASESIRVDSGWVASYDRDEWQNIVLRTVANWYPKQIKLQEVA